MKRLVQVLMVAAVVVGFARSADADPLSGLVADFTWTDDYISGWVVFILSNATDKAIGDVSVQVKKATTTPPAPPNFFPYVALMGSDAVGAFDQLRLQDPYPEPFPFLPGEIDELTVSFLFDDSLRFERTFFRAELEGVPDSEMTKQHLFYLDEGTPAPIPEPTSLALFGLAAAGAAFVRRRRA